MREYVIRRLLQVIPVLFITSVAVFLLLRLIPGDPALIYAGADETAEVVEAVREHMGPTSPFRFSIFYG